MVDKTKCISCGGCIAICPVGAIKFVDGKAHIDPKICVKCGSCQNFCPMGAIDISKPEPEAKPDKKSKK